MRPFQTLPFLWFALLLLSFSRSFSSATLLSKWEGTYFCKCICFQNYTILPLDLFTAPQAKPCLTCTKQWCLDQQLTICTNATLGDTDPDTATGKEGDVEARCFQRDSPRDQVVVTLFLLTVFGLLLGAGIKSRMEQTGFSPSWPTGTPRWWEAWLPGRQAEGAGYNLANTGRGESGDYSALAEDGGTPTSAALR